MDDVPDGGEESSFGVESGVQRTISRYHVLAMNTTTQSFLRTRRGLSYNAPASASVYWLGVQDISCD